MENFPYIPFVPDKNIVMRRVGSQKAHFLPDIDSEINTCLKDAGSLFAAKGRAGIFDIEHLNAGSPKNGTFWGVKDGCIRLKDIRIESANLAKLLSASLRVYIMCATIPQKNLDLINDAIDEGRGLRALVLDAYASEYIDGALDVIMQRKNTSLKRTGQRLTKNRFSAGYGDLDIKYQKVFYDLLEMQSLEVSISDKFLLVPEKSVIAIAGVE